MLVATAPLADGSTLVLVGLSAENRRRLAEGLPIRLAIAGVSLIFFAGETEAEMKETLAGLIGPGTVVLDHSRPN